MLSLAPNDLLVFLGDSITEQHLWTLYIETELVTRLPQHRLRFRNRGVGGNRAPHGLERFAQDVAPLQPQWVFIAFGMNDGAYQPPSPWRLREYRTALSALIAATRALGACPVVVGPTCCGAPWTDYNETLLRLAAEAESVAAEHGVPAIRLFEVLLGRDDLLPDGIHPNEAGHRLLAEQVLAQFDLPPAPRFRSDQPPGHYSLYTEGQFLTMADADQLRAGVSLAPTATLLDLGNQLWHHDRAAWRDQLRPSEADAHRAIAAAIERERLALAAAPLSVTVAREEPFAFTEWEVAGPYPAGDADPYFMPVAPAGWRTVPAVHGRVDFIALWGQVNYAAAFARSTVSVAAKANLMLSLGSDDGFQVYVNGEFVTGRNLCRGAAPGQDQVRVPLRPGPNELLLRITQASGGWEFIAEGRIRHA